MRCNGDYNVGSYYAQFMQVNYAKCTTAIMVIIKNHKGGQT